jgi:2'-5' RNA ligase
LDKLGVFSKKFVKIVWVKVSNVSLQKLIDNSLADIFEKEWRFMGHITIARVKNLKNKSFFLELINKTNVNKIVFMVKEFYLKESILRKEGPIYKFISTYKVQKNEQNI